MHLEIMETPEGKTAVLKDGEVIRVFDEAWQAQDWVAALTGDAVIRMDWEK